MTEYEDKTTLSTEGRPPSQFKPVLQGRKQRKLITLEEHAVTPFKIPATSATFNTFEPEILAGLKDRLVNIDLRIKIMDANNIGAQIISLNQPTAQAFTKLDGSLEFCRKANEFIHQTYCLKHPQRFFAFATLPTEDGQAAATELERCVKEYEFVGAMINGYTATEDPAVGVYLDHPQFDALWEVAQRLQTPIFIHPQVPLASNLKVLEDIPVLHGAPYGFARETVEHVFRLMYTGVFDRFPQLKICLGHMDAQGPKQKSFQSYFQENIIANTSGMPRTSALINLLSEAKISNIMFSVDYPYEVKLPIIRIL
ncbi:hypothetical protein LTR49_025578 [Elasticomyces elasticus]|nr:hypothetical protein LTR49_025578 [Elasticomyces elasticus]